MLKHAEFLNKCLAKKNIDKSIRVKDNVEELGYMPKLKYVFLCLLSICSINKFTESYILVTATYINIKKYLLLPSCGILKTTTSWIIIKNIFQSFIFLLKYGKQCTISM